MVHNHLLRIVRLVAQDVLGVIDARPDEPLGTRHLALCEDRLVRRGRHHLEIVVYRGPECLDLPGGPGLQLTVVGEVEAALLAEPAQEISNPCPLLEGIAAFPQEIPLLQHPLLLRMYTMPFVALYYRHGGAGS